MPKKRFMDRIETKRAMITGILVALLVLSAEALRYIIEIIVTEILKQQGITEPGAYPYFFGFSTAAVVLLSFLYKYSNLLEK